MRFIAPLLALLTISAPLASAKCYKRGEEWGISKNEKNLDVENVCKQLVGTFTANEMKHTKITKSKLVRAFRESTNTFLDSALIFAVSMLGAAIVRYSRVIMHPEEDVSYYSLLGSVYMAAFSIFPALLLQTVADGLHGKILRQALWFLLILFAIVTEVMSVASPFYP